MRQINQFPMKVINTQFNVVINLLTNSLSPHLCLRQTFCKTNLIKNLSPLNFDIPFFTDKIGYILEFQILRIIFQNSKNFSSKVKFFIKLTAIFYVFYYIFKNILLYLKNYSFTYKFILIYLFFIYYIFKIFSLTYKFIFIFFLI